MSFVSSFWSHSWSRTRVPTLDVPPGLGQLPLSVFCVRTFRGAGFACLRAPRDCEVSSRQPMCLEFFV